MPIPDRLLSQDIEDVQSTENNIDILFDKFISPIEKIRSISLSSVGTLSAQDKSQIRSNLIINTEAVESRVHAFYRLIGFPILDKQGRYYNPGFNSTRSLSEEKKDSINTNQDSKILLLMLTRENHIRFLQKVFSQEDISSSILSLLMGSHPKPFNVFDKSEQTFKVIERSDELEHIRIDNANLNSDIDAAKTFFSNSPITQNIDSNIHILKPFQVNPLLEFTVMPSNNLIAVPFLKDAVAAQSSASPKIVHDRPGIEYILRARLADTTPDKYFLLNMKNILSQEKSSSPTFISDTNTEVLKDTLFALADQNNIDNVDITSLFQNITNTEANIIKQLIKTIKVVIEQLHNSVLELDKVRLKINFLPIPDKHGPENIGSIRNTVANTKLDNQIIQLTIKKLNSETQIQTQQNLGTFASSSFNLEKNDTYTEQLSQATQLRNDLGNSGLNHLRIIEIITGEVSGLGLIDILAIYTALWSINIEDLLGLLDQDSFDRLYNYNPDLHSSPVANKTRSNINDALFALETRVGNILSFADKLYSNSLSSPQESENGEI